MARDARPQLLDPPRMSPPAVSGKARHSRRSAPDEDVEVIQSASRYPDDRLARPWAGTFHGLEQEPFGPPVFADQRRSHRVVHRPPITSLITLPPGSQACSRRAVVHNGASDDRPTMALRGNAGLLVLGVVAPVRGESYAQVRNP